jgi:amino acid transporter
MIHKYINTILENNILLSLAIGIISNFIIYIDNRRTKKTQDSGVYFKNIVIISLIVYLVFYMKNKKLPIKESSIKIGEPDF